MSDASCSKFIWPFCTSQGVLEGLNVQSDSCRPRGRRASWVESSSRSSGMSCRLAHYVCGFALAALACTLEEPMAPEAPSTAGGSAGGGAPDMMGGQTGEGGGENDGCFAETWAGPDSERV